MIRFTILFFLSLIVSARAEVVTLIGPSQEMPGGKTVVWSPLFQATWDKMNETIGGKPKKIEPPNELMTKLDTFVWEPEKIMPEGGWQTWSGPATKDFLDRVNTESIKLTGEDKGPFKLDNYSPRVIACFGLLNREVEFEKAFYKSTKVPMQFGNEKTAVRFFGIKGRESGDYGKSVKVLAYRPKDGSHALEISCKEIDDKVILYMPPKSQNFDTACNWIREWRKAFAPDEKTTDDWNDRYLHAEDEVIVPYVSFKTETDLKQDLVGDRFYGRPDDPWTILAAIQNTKFDLYEKGARVRVEVTLLSEPFGGPVHQPIPRKFIYDRPFFVFLWRENVEWPYLGVWVADDSVL